MSDKVYASAAGFVQFDPREREANGKKVVDVAIKAIGWEGQPILNITVWPEFQLVTPIKRGDWVGADGEFTQNVYQDKSGAQKTGLQISAKSLVHTPSVPRLETQVVQAAATSAVAAEVVQAAPAATSLPF